MKHCGNKSAHGSHDSCPGTRSNPLPTNIVMYVVQTLFLFLLILCLRALVQFLKRRQQ